jgi:hypothetical protein
MKLTEYKLRSVIKQELIKFLNEIEETELFQREPLIEDLLNNNYVKIAIQKYTESVTAAGFDLAAPAPGGTVLNREQLSFVKIYLRRICMALEYAYEETLDSNLSDDEINKLSEENLYNTNFYNTLDRISLEFERAIEQSIPSKSATLFDERESLNTVNDLIQQYITN